MDRSRVHSLLLSAAGLAMVAGCGAVNFIDAPFAPREIDYRYSPQEDVTVVRWHMSAQKPDSDVRFEIFDADGAWHPIDFGASVFRGGVETCDRGTCAQMVFPGEHPPGDARTSLRAIHPDYGVLPGNKPALHTDLKTLELAPAFLRDNKELAVTITDRIGGRCPSGSDTDDHPCNKHYQFPRDYQNAIWERRGVCVPGFHPADTQFDAIDADQKTWPAPDPLSTEGRYCASVRGMMTTGDPGIDEPVAVDTLPEIVSQDHLYTVPTELSPFSYRIIMDLSIPVADRCPLSLQLIQSTVATVLQKYTQTRTLPAIDLSAGTDPETGDPAIPCRQSPARSIDAAAIAQDVKLAASTWTEQHPRFFLLYFNNLQAPLPDGMTTSLDDFERTIITPPPPNDFVSAVWGFGPPEMTSSFSDWSKTVPWQSATEMSFAQELDDFGKASLPLISEVQDPAQPIPIMTAADAARFDGGLIRLCQVSVTPMDGAVQPITHDPQTGAVVRLDTSTKQWPVRQADPPAYLLNLPPVWAVSKVGFFPHQAHIRYEICTRYCDHAFTSETGTIVPDGWTDNPDGLCMGPPEAGT